MNLGLKGKRAVVTGGSQGIGRACAVALAKEGTRVCIVARNRKPLDVVVREINDAGGEGYAVAVDLRHLEGCKQVVNEVRKIFGGVDILVNNVGAARNSDVLSLDVDQISEALQLKSYSYLRMAQLVIPDMKENGWGRIVNIAGGAGTSPTRGNIPTGAANITILNMTRALSDAVAGDGILVNTVCPGLTNTPRARTQQRGRAEREGRDVEEVLKELGAELPAGRMAEPEDIANTVTFLASEACSYIFGSSIYMDGGGRRSTP